MPKDIRSELARHGKLFTAAPIGVNSKERPLYVQTNTLASNSLSLTLATTNAMRFYRAQWLP